MSSTPTVQGRLGGLTEFTREEIAKLHVTLDFSVGDLQGDQWHWTSNGAGTSIASSLWRYARTEDDLLHRTITQRPTVWISEGFAERSHGELALTASTEERLLDAQELQAYAGRVWLETALWLNSPSEAAYESPVLLDGTGMMPSIAALALVSLTEGWACLGTIRQIRSLLRLPSVTA
jgi:hypothetical protein